MAEGNPYQTPGSLDAREAEPFTELRSPLVMAGIGLIVGGMAGVTAGAATAAILAALVGVWTMNSAGMPQFYVSPERFLMAMIVASAFLGTVLGGIVCGALGMVCGLLITLLPEVPRKTVVTFGVLAMGIAGALLGALAIQTSVRVFGGIPRSHSVILFAHGIVLGGVAGAVAGKAVVRSRLKVVYLRRPSGSNSRSSSQLAD